MAKKPFHLPPSIDAIRASIQPQECVLIPGMTNAPEACQLAWQAWSPELHPAEAFGEVKVDGIRLLYIAGRLVTREAVPFNAALHCLPFLAAMEQIYGEPCVIDAEYFSGSFSATLADFRRGVGAGTAHLLDIVPLREWQANRFTEPEKVRVANLSVAYLAASEQFRDQGRASFVKRGARLPLPLEKVMLAAHAVWDQDGEGLVVKDARALYTRGRTISWLKVKRGAEIEGTVMDVAAKGGIETAVALVRLDGRITRIAGLTGGVLALAALDLDGKPGGLTGRTVTVSYMERTESGAFRQASIKSIRDGF